MIMRSGKKWLCPVAGCGNCNAEVSVYYNYNNNNNNNVWLVWELVG